MTKIPAKIMIEVISHTTYIIAILTHTHYNLLLKGNKKMITPRQEVIDNLVLYGILNQQTTTELLCIGRNKKLGMVLSMTPSLG